MKIRKRLSGKWLLFNTCFTSKSSFNFHRNTRWRREKLWWPYDLENYQQRKNLLPTRRTVSKTLLGRKQRDSTTPFEPTRQLWERFSSSVDPQDDQMDNARICGYNLWLSLYIWTIISIEKTSEELSEISFQREQPYQTFCLGETKMFTHTFGAHSPVVWAVLFSCWPSGWPGGPLASPKSTRRPLGRTNHRGISGLRLDSAQSPFGRAILQDWTVIQGHRRVARRYHGSTESGRWETNGGVTTSKMKVIWEDRGMATVRRSLQHFEQICWEKMSREKTRKSQSHRVRHRSYRASIWY